MPTRLFRNLSLWSVGIIWALAGVSKLIDPLLGSSPNQQVTWASSFPNSLMVLIAILEVVLALLIFARFRWTPILVGSVMLTSFMIALWVWPLDYQQPCGCFGKIKLFDAIDPVAKVIVFSGLNALAAALTWVCQVDKGAHDNERPEKLAV